MGLFDRLRGDDDERVVFLGIDGVPYDLVQNHPDVFENLTDIAETGSAGRPESIVPPSRARAGRVSRRGKIPARPACTASRTARSTPTRRTSRWGNTCRRRGCGTASPTTAATRPYSTFPSRSRRRADPAAGLRVPHPQSMRPRATTRSDRSRGPRLPDRCEREARTRRRQDRVHRERARDARRPPRRVHHTTSIRTTGTSSSASS